MFIAGGHQRTDRAPRGPERRYASALHHDVPVCNRCHLDIRWIVTAFETGASSEDKPATFKASIKVSGQPVLGIGASAGFTTPFLSTSTGTLFPVAASTTSTISRRHRHHIDHRDPDRHRGRDQRNGEWRDADRDIRTASSAIALGAAGTTTLVTITVTESAAGAARGHRDIAAAAGAWFRPRALPAAARRARRVRPMRCRIGRSSCQKCCSLAPPYATRPESIHSTASAARIRKNRIGLRPGGVIRLVLFVTKKKV